MTMLQVAVDEKIREPATGAVGEPLHFEGAGLPAVDHPLPEPPVTISARSRMVRIFNFTCLPASWGRHALSPLRVQPRTLRRLGASIAGVMVDGPGLRLREADEVISIQAKCVAEHPGCLLR